VSRSLCSLRAIRIAGVGAMLSAHVPAEETICVPRRRRCRLLAPGWSWALDDVATVSLCGRPLETLRRRSSRTPRVVLSADATRPPPLPAISRARLRAIDMHVLKLGGPRDRVRDDGAHFGFNDVEATEPVAIEVEASPGAKIIPLASGLPDEMFEHDGQITKREIRAVTLSSLGPRAGELLWDIGCGSGSIAIEWLLRHQANRAIAIERAPLRAARAARNASELGVPRLEMVTGEALPALDPLPAPNAIFIGGGGEPALIDKAYAALKPGGRIVANAITFDTERAMLAAQSSFGGTLTRLSVERLDAVGGKQAFRPAMTVTQWSVTKP
jgi:precorrin-6Y C5,15-methyltransferase (decarboxylating)